jgi:ribosomal protein S18 acetylase RimI-like enzyme
MADASVRPAVADDADDVADVQAQAWREAYPDVLPRQSLAALGGEAGAARWREAVAEPPSPRHRVLVACAGADVVGFAAFGPGADPDLDASVDAEVHAFVVRSEHARAGHGSRLLTATVEHLRADGFRHVHVWLATRDDALRAFLAGAGWAADGATRSLDLRGDGEVLAQQVRLHTDISDTAFGDTAFGDTASGDAPPTQTSAPGRTSAPADDGR